jgi:CHAD domain-containing protein
MPTNTIETEIKFTISDRATFKSLKELNQVGQFSLNPIGAKKVSDQYLDTAGFKFFHAGYACRIRRDKKMMILTLKSLTPPEGKIHRREELEAVIPSVEPETWPGSEAKDRVLAISGGESLTPLFTINQMRHKFHAMANQQPVIELSLDQVTAGKEKYFELEAELMASGTEDTLTQFAAALQNDWPLEPAGESKFERAFTRQYGEEELLTEPASAQEEPVLPELAAVQEPEVSEPVKKAKKAVEKKTGKRLRQSKMNHKSKKPVSLPASESAGLTITDSFAEAGRKTFCYHFAEMLKFEPGTAKGADIEDLHDMRVATRRLRAAFRLFGPAFEPSVIKPLLAKLKATGRALGPVRDLDVFMEELQNYQHTLPPEGQHDFQSLLDAWQVKRDPARAAMLDYLDSNGYQRFKKEFYAFATTPGMGVKPIPVKIPPTPSQVRHIAPGLIYHAYDQVRAYETVIENAPIETLHQLRITFKGLRYTLEFFREILGEGKDLVIEDIKLMQDHLGNLNDADVAITILHEFLEEWDERQVGLAITERKNPAPMAAYLTTQMEKRHQLLVTFPEVWANFNRPELRRSLALAISGL